MVLGLSSSMSIECRRNHVVVVDKPLQKQKRMHSYNYIP